LDGVVKPELSDAITKVLNATHKAGKKCGIFCTSGEQSKFYADQGFDMISVATDVTALGQVMAQTVATAKGLQKPETKGSY
jgi:4-hydroxy-2-oxoheptanedioate aldolase